MDFSAGSVRPITVFAFIFLFLFASCLFWDYVFFPLTR